MSKSSKEILEKLRAEATRHLADLVGIKVIELTPKRVVATMPVDDRTRQPFGILHGGASLVLSETIASLGGAMNADLERFNVVGLEINANHIRAKKDGVVTGTGVPFHTGRSTQVWDIRIVDEDQRPICISRCTIAVVPKIPGS